MNTITSTSLPPVLEQDKEKMNTFKTMGLPPVLERALDELQFTTPTPIQEKTIPRALQGSDILGSAKTGTGKTLAFSLPLLNHLLNTTKGSALVLAPTRELAHQIHTTIRTLIGNRFAIKTSILIGGEAYGKQFAQLRMRPRIVIGTPGRVIDHLERKTLVISACDFLVLDETDRMFDMGLGTQVHTIISFMPHARQTLMFSATFTPKIEDLARKYLKNPERIFVDSGRETAQNLTEEVIEIQENDKRETLSSMLDQREGSILIFVKTRFGAGRLARYLSSENHSATAIHGDLSQRQRDRVMNGFRNGLHRIMVATDVAARGLDIPHIRHVINYDLPQCPEDYIHRVGRTARAGAQGSALNFISPKDKQRWYAIQRLMHPTKQGHKQSTPSRNRRRHRTARSRFWNKNSSTKASPWFPKKG